MVAITVPALAVHIGLKLLSSFVSMLAAAGSATALTLSALLASAIGFLEAVLPAVGWGLVAVILAAALYSLLHAFSTMVSNDFNQIHESAQAEDSKDPFEELRRHYRRRSSRDHPLDGGDRRGYRGAWGLAWGVFHRGS